MIKLLKKEDLVPRFHTYPLLGSFGFVRLHYTEWGPRDAERTVICLHGLTRNGRDFDFLARHLAQRGMRVVAPDLPGRGRSERLPGAHHYVTETYLSAMAALLCRLDVTEVDWVGTSLGGHIGTEFAARRGAPVRRLVLNDFGARLQGAALNRLGRYSRVRKQFDSMDELEQHLRTIYQPFGNLTDEQWRHMTEHSAARDDHGFYCQNYDPAISNDFMLWPAMLDIALWHVWERVECPVLILRGETSDLLLPGTVDQMKARGIAAAKGLVESMEIPGCGHAPALMAPEQIRVIEEFLVRDEPRAEARQASG
ncbi:MAG: alpha/beta hydrolase [Burkholderiales bacterium]|nr:alpha/beta hydrolase [Burkholderiales bacterium]